MTYHLEKDFLYIQNTLFATIESSGLDCNNIDSYTLVQLLEQCATIYGSSPYDDESPAECERYASLRRAQMNIRRFWYYYTLLKWRMQSA